MIDGTIDKAVKVGKIDRCFIRLDAEWLDGELIIAPVVTSSASGVFSVGAVDIASNEIGFIVTGVGEGSAIAHISYTTSGGRSDCKSVRIYVEDC